MDTLNLNYRTWGSGKPLIMLHGLFGSGVNWQSAGRQLSRRWSVFAPDLRNHGDSPHSPGLSYRAMTDDLKEFMNRRRIERAVLMGHSLGGKVSMAFADRFPGRTEGLIIADIAPKPYPAGHRKILDALIGFDVSRVKSRKEALGALAPSIPSLPVRQFLLQSLRRETDGSYCWKINLEAIDRHLEQLSRGPHLTKPYDGPVLFMSGSKSAYITDADEELIRRHYPACRIVVIQGAGHWLHFDAPEKTIAAMDTFLNSAFDDNIGPWPGSEVS